MGGDRVGVHTGRMKRALVPPKRGYDQLAPAVFAGFQFRTDVARPNRNNINLVPLQQLVHICVAIVLQQLFVDRAHSLIGGWNPVRFFMADGCSHAFL